MSIAVTTAEVLILSATARLLELDEPGAWSNLRMQQSQDPMCLGMRVDVAGVYRGETKVVGRVDTRGGPPAPYALKEALLAAYAGGAS